MLVYNAGLEKIEFDFNKSARNPKEGGSYTVAPGKTLDIPEAARAADMDPNCGPCLWGLVILEYGADLHAKKKEGLTKAAEFLERRLEWELQRDQEREAAGFKVLSERKAITALKAQYAKVGKLLEDLENGHVSNAPNKSPNKPGRPKRIKSAAVLSSVDQAAS